MQCLRHYFTSLQRAYTKEAQENFSKYTSVVDTPEITLAKMNSVNQSDVCTLFLKIKILIEELGDYLIAFANYTIFSLIYLCVHLINNRLSWGEQV